MLWALVACLLICNVPRPIKARHLHLSGKDANIKDFAYQASIRDTRNWDLHICGGFFYRSSVVITAAHCVFDRPVLRLQVYGGSSDRFDGGNVSYVDRVVVHPEFDEYYRYNDIAVLILSTPFNLSTTLATIEVAKPSEVAASKQTALVSGWGQFNTNSALPRKLRCLNVFTISDADCNKYFAMTEKAICAQTNDKTSGICIGDSGDPMVIEVKSGVQNVSIKKVAGIVSTLVEHLCANGGPVAFTRISKYQEWISRITARSGNKCFTNNKMLS